ncbi:MAG: threonine/serine exporter family protein [Andreesenia angusta]|nr:threonine/serine exporter family protein [Andreesenia angusta]
MFIFQQALYSFLSTLGFSVLFNSPKDCIMKASFCGMAGWLVKMSLTSSFNSNVGGTFFGAMTVGIIGEALARKNKKPATVFIIPGIIPLVPGAGMYYTMINFINNNFSKTIEIGSDAIFTAISIAIAVIVASSLSRFVIRGIDKRRGYVDIIKKRSR